MYKKLRFLAIRSRVSLILSIGFLIRFGILVLHTPTLANELYLPFFNNQSGPFDFDPVNQLTESQVSPFPYGLPMYLVSLPVHFAVKISGGVDYSLMIGIALVAFSIIPDFIIMSVLLTLKKDYRALSIWAFSPIVLSSTYYSGQTDLWPALALLVSAYFILEKRRFYSAGLALGLAIGFKYGLILVVPFIIVFMLDNPRYKKSIRELLMAAVTIATISYIPTIFSAEFRNLVFGGNTKNEVFSLFINLNGFNLYLVPATYLLLLVWIYRAGRTTTQVLVVFLSVAVISISTLTPASFGWTLWTFPTLIAFLSFKDFKLIIVLSLFQILYFLAKSEFMSLKIAQVSDFYHSTLNTLLIVFTFVLMTRILQHGVKQGDLYGLAKKPFSISIAGDSGVGKDTLANLIVGAFGKDASTVICGDNYHLYERGDYVWGSRTHLNPRMNDLKRWKLDLNELLNRNVIQSREYDHSVGRFSSAGIYRKSDLVVSQGLHANYFEVSTNIDASIFVEMEEELRLHLKIQRDTFKRNQSLDEIQKQLSLRKPDYDKHIECQKEASDICIKFKSKNNTKVSVIEVSSGRLPGFHEELLSVLLTYFPEAIIDESQEFDSFTIDSIHVERSSIESALQRKLLSFDQFFPVRPKFEDEMSGLVQLICFMLIDYKRKNSVVMYEYSK